MRMPRRTQWKSPIVAQAGSIPIMRPYPPSLKRLRVKNRKVVLYDAHSILSQVPRLFDGALPQFNIGTNGGVTCDPALTHAVEAATSVSGRGYVIDGRFPRRNGRRVTTVNPVAACMPYRWSWRCADIWSNPPR